MDPINAFSVATQVPDMSTALQGASRNIPSRMEHITHYPSRRARGVGGLEHSRNPWTSHSIGHAHTGGDTGHGDGALGMSGGSCAFTKG